MKPSILALTSFALVAGLSAAQQLEVSRSRSAPGNQGAPTPGMEPAIAASICAISIRDQANPGSCLQATSVPTPGLLFPGPHTGGVNNLQGGANSFVGGGEDNSSSGQVSSVGGGSNNTASAGWATVAGGGYNQAQGLGSAVGGGVHNLASQYKDGFATVAGGYGNAATGDFSAVVGGLGNQASHGFSTVGGGSNNGASGSASTIGGGASNMAPGQLATVSGGGQNRAAGYGSVSPGGRLNEALGDFSFAAGRRAQAAHHGAFVWGDSQDADKNSSAANEFNVFCSGGARFFSDAAQTSGVSLAPGGGAWSSMSDRESKENFVPVDARDVLARVSALPLSTWNYRSQEDSVRHLGPTAQDFRAAFGLGASEKTIDTIDPDGVALAAIQGLNELVRERDGEIAELREANEALQRRVARIEAFEVELGALREALHLLVESR